MEDESASSIVKIEQMKETISSLESEVGGLKSDIDVYECHIASLADDVASLEMKAFRQIKFDAAEYSEEKSPQGVVDPHVNYHEKGGQSNLPNGVQELKRLQTRIKAIEEVVLQEMKHMSWESPKSLKLVPEAATNEIEELSYCNLYERNKNPTGRSSHDKEHSENVNPRKARIRASDCIQMKDIPLDRVSSKSKYIARRRNNIEASGSDDKMLELWETLEDCVGKSFRRPACMSTETKKVIDQFDNFKRRHLSDELEMEKGSSIDKLIIATSPANNQVLMYRKILERLASDADRLVNLQITVQSLRRKLDTNKKNTKSKDFDFDTLKEQLLEVEETVVQMADLNGQLMKTTEEGSRCSARKTSRELKDTLVSIRLKEISDQARKGSEKIGHLQLEVQKFEYMLLKLGDERKGRFSQSKTTTILRDFTYNRKKRGSEKHEKSHICGCFSRPSYSRYGKRKSCSSPRSP